MKKIIVSVLMCAPLAIVAQPTLTYRTHGLKAGENHSMQKVEYVSPGNEGAKQLWDFRSLSITDPGHIETVESGVGDKMQVTSADGKSVFSYTCNKNANVYEGYKNDSRTVEFKQPVTKISYPFTYGSSLFGFFDGICSYGTNLSLAGAITGDYSSAGDAFGVLLLPDNVTLNNVLRVKTRESYVESLCSDVHIEVVKYLWYAAEYRYPVFVTWEITYAYENGKTQTTSESFVTTEKLTSSIESPAIAENSKPTTEPEEVTDVKYTLHPNPYSSYFHLTYELKKETKVNIVLYTATGQFIAQLVKDQRQNGIQHITYNPHTTDFAGFYVLRMTFDDKTYTKTLIRD
jgi:hypothetical protein